MLSKPMRGARPNRQHWSAKGLVGEWLFNEGCGTKVMDSSGNENHGTLTDMASPPTATSGWGAGRRGVGLRFDGSNDYVNCSNDDSIEFTDAFTIIAWVKSRVSGERGVLGKFRNVGAGQFKGYQIENFFNHYYLIIADGNGDKVSCNAYHFPFGIWYHVAGVLDSGNLYMYINGELKAGPTPISGYTPYTDHSLYLGRTGDIAPKIFSGSLGSVEIYNYEWTAKQVAWDYINEYARYQPRLTLAQLRYFVELGVITDPSISSLSVNRTMRAKTIDRTIESLTPERTFNLGV